MLTRRTVLLGLAAQPVVAGAAAPLRTGRILIAAARRQVGVTMSYDSDYAPLGFPGGDVPRSRGVCTDVVIRAYRDAFGLDLQALVNADMRAHFAAYPRTWRLSHPDRSIDHRRVPNLRTFFTRAGAARSLPADARGWRPGDIFTCLIAGRLPHIGIVSDRGQGWVIHNIGAGTREEPALYANAITGRYRWMLRD